MPHRDRFPQLNPSETPTASSSVPEGELNFADLVAQITPENRYHEIRMGREVGKEKVDW